jgi:hypothetical protein
VVRGMRASDMTYRDKGWMVQVGLSYLSPFFQEVSDQGSGLSCECTCFLSFFLSLKIYNTTKVYRLRIELSPVSCV